MDRPREISIRICLPEPGVPDDYGNVFSDDAFDELVDKFGSGHRRARVEFTPGEQSLKLILIEED